MFILKQPCPQLLLLIVMKYLVQNGQAFEQILGKKQTFLLNQSCLCFLCPK